MSRIPTVDPSRMSVDQRQVYDAVVQGPRGKMVGPLRVVLHNAELADKWAKFGEDLRYNTSVPRILSELAIIITARRWNSDLEWHAHSVEALKAGLSAETVEAIRIAALPKFKSLIEARVYEFVRCMQEFGNVPDDLYEDLRNDLGVAGIMELSSISGYYTLVAMTLNVHNVPLPDEASDNPLPVIGSGLSLTPLPEFKMNELSF